MNKISCLLLILSIIGIVYSDGPECSPEEDGTVRFACPTTDAQGRYRCIADHQICDATRDCPNGEEEDPKACMMFYKSANAHLNILADALLQMARDS
uniref:Venom peptide n=1 Tax=Comana monomorpha TaxID=1555636 RepID=A0AAU6PAU2_9NEOP